MFDVVVKKILFILMIFAISSCDFTPAEEYYNRAICLEKQERWEEAIINLDKAIKKRPEYRPALLNRGNNKTALGDLNGGIEDYKKLLEFDPFNTIALVNIGNNLRLLKKHDKAIIYYSEALETEGAIRSFADSNDGTFGIQRNLDFNLFDSDIEYNMHDSEIFFYRGIEYLELEKFDNAISDINKSLKANFAKRDCYFLLGEAYLGKRDSITSCQYFIKSARLGDKEAKEMLKKHCI